MSFTIEEKTEEFERLKEFLDSVEIAAEILPPGKLTEEPSLLVCLPSVEDAGREGEIRPEDLHVAAGYFLNLDDTEQRLTKYLIFYTQIEAEFSSMSDLEILTLINQLNRTVRVGHYFYGKVDGSDAAVVQYRTTVACADGEPFDEGVIGDTIVEMGAGYDIAKETFAHANKDRETAAEER